MSTKTFIFCQIMPEKTQVKDDYPPSHVVRSVTKSNEFPQKRDQWKMYRTYMYFKGLYSLKSFTMGFNTFVPKMGQKGL